MIIETSLNLKNKNKEELMLLLNESLGVIEKLQKENEELNKNYNFLIDKIILKIDEYDYKFKKLKSKIKMI